MDPAPNLSNSSLAELLALAAADAKGHTARALRRASRLAFSWPIEAASLLDQDRSFTELSGIGPFLSKQLRAWLADPPPVPKPPEIRQNFFTVSRARALLDASPKWLARVKGDLQMHTEWSDGSGTITAMAAAASERGYEYIAITDHSKGLKIAGGIDETELARQGREIEKTNAALAAAGKSTTVLRSIEMNLNPAGEGDLDPAILKQLDIVLGSFHSSLRRTDDQTTRYIAALRNPYVHILGHPRCRIYNYRIGLHADWPRVFATAAKLDKAIEIDGYPDRQDIDVKLLRLARAEGCRISFGTDAHHPPQLAFIVYSAAAALHAKIRPDRILNFMPRDELLKWTARLRAKIRK